ncbi:hypothetical protein [Yunchengibacter salinarum]
MSRKHPKRGETGLTAHDRKHLTVLVLAALTVIITIFMMTD